MLRGAFGSRISAPPTLDIYFSLIHSCVPLLAEEKIHRVRIVLLCSKMTEMRQFAFFLQENRNSRMARYKEERRKQLAADFGNLESPRNHGAGSSSSSEGPRPTRASRLRAQASQCSITPLGGFFPSPNLDSGVGRLNSTMFPHGEESPKRKVERDKSSKRKSNLNRSLTSEAVPPPSCSYGKVCSG